MDRLSDVGRVLRNAAPHRLPEEIAAVLGEHYDAGDVRLRMVDYGMRSLQSTGPAGPDVDAIPIQGTPEGRAFGAQEPWVDADPVRRTVTVHLPVTVRGDRMGVLTVVLPETGYTPAVLPELQTACEALGHEILVAERDTDRYVIARRATRLTLAAEMQWQLLPGRSCDRPEFSLGAHLEPAYAVFGDNFDWSNSADALTLTVTDGMGDGIDAALLTNLAVNALRNARRAGLGLADQARLADQAVYAQHQGAVHLSVLLLRFDLATGEAEAVDAGSPRVWRLRDRVVEPVTFEAQLPLGMFEDTPYVVQRFEVRPGDRLLLGSDGVYDVEGGEGERYGHRAVARSLLANSLLPAAQVPRAVLHELAAHRGEAPVADDAIVVCLDWHGRPDDGPADDAGSARPVPLRRPDTQPG